MAVILACIVALVVIYILFVQGDYGLYQYWQLQKEKRSLEQKIDELKAERDLLDREIELLKSNKMYIEKVAREKYKMGRPDETVYYIEADSSQKP